MEQLSEHLTTEDMMNLVTEWGQANDFLDADKEVMPQMIPSLLAFMFEKGVAQGKAEK